METYIGMSEQLLEVYDKQARIISQPAMLDNSYANIEDLAFYLTEAERYDLLRHLYDQKINANNAPYTAILQNHLAKYKGDSTHNVYNPALNDFMNEMHTISTYFIQFETFIQDKVNVNSTINNLNETTFEFMRQITNNINALKHKYHDNADILKILTQLQDKLLASRDSFVAQNLRLQRNIPTHNQLERLVCIQDRDHSIKSLGNFIAQNMTDVLDAGIKIAYEINDNRLHDLFKVNPAVAALSDAKKMILTKTSLNGVEYNNSYVKIDDSMLAILTANTRPADSDDRKWFSLKHYLHDWHPAEIDKVICLITGRHLADTKQPSWLIYGSLKFIASFIEAAVVISIRLPTTLLLTVINLTNVILDKCASLIGINWFHMDPENAWTKRIDDQLSQWHSNYSPVKYAKHSWNKHYLRTNDNSQSHQDILHRSMQESSVFHQFFIYCSPQQLTAMIIGFLNEIWLGCNKILQDLSYLGSSLAQADTETPQQVYDRIYRVNHVLQQIPLDLRVAEDIWASPKFWEMNEISSPLEIFREVMLTLSDVMIDPMFRKSPAFATLFFMLSGGTFVTYLLPQAGVGCMQTMTMQLQAITNWLSIHFTGEEASAGLMEQMIACVLEWKLGFFSAELLMELKQGNYEFFETMFDEPEHVTMGLLSLISAGALIQFIPLLPNLIQLPQGINLPNVYAEIVNLFIEESKTCAQGTFPFNGLEFGFLGLKFALLLRSMSSGYHHDDVLLGQLDAHLTAPEVDSSARGQLLAALTLLGNKTHSLHFLSKNRYEAHKIYDHLDFLFREYNHEMQRIGHAEACVDSRDFMATFYNKYCFQGSNNFLRILSIFPGYPILLIWRGIKLLMAHILNRPSIAWQVQRSFNKDLVLLFQVATIFVGPMNAFARSVSYTIRPFVALSLLAVTIIPFVVYRISAAILQCFDVNVEVMTRKSWFKLIDQITCKIALHHVDIPHFLRVMFAQSARVAGSARDLAQISEQLSEQINSVQIQDPPPVLREIDYISPDSVEGSILTRLDSLRNSPPAATNFSINEDELQQELNNCWSYTASKMRGTLFAAPVNRRQPFYTDNTPFNNSRV